MRNPLRKAAGPPPVEDSTYVKIEPGTLDTVFVAPKWLRDVGFTSWFLVGAALVVVAAVTLLAITETIVMPVLVASIIAAVTSPLVSYLQRHGVPRLGGAVIVLLLVIVVAGLVTYAIFSGVLSYGDQISSQLNKAMTSISNWLSHHGIDPEQAKKAKASASQSTSDGAKTLLEGVKTGISMLSGLAIFLAFLFLSLVFLLKDGPMIRAWGERRMGVPPPVAHIITGRLISSMRGYFVGVTIVATFNAVVVGISAWVLNVPLVATIMIVTFVGAYIPYLGAWAAGAFAVLIALGTGDQTAVVGMVVMCLLANGILQQLIQPVAYGAALGIHPLAVLIVTIAAGCLFGGIGLILGAPVTSAIVRISADLGNARERDDAPATGTGGGDPLPAPT
ncbi:MAG: AI-2E family transporter [Solirubrobacterales bacterium]